MLPIASKILSKINRHLSFSGCRQLQLRRPLVSVPSQALLGGVVLLLSAGLASAQVLEPRRWSHLPVGSSFTGFAYSYTDFDIAFDPSLEIEDATAEVHTLTFNYLHVIDVFGKSGRIDLLVQHSNGRWEGLLQGEPASTERNGFNDPRLRVAVNLLGSPAQRGSEFQPIANNTILGMALDVTAPLGEYKDDKLINLGANRWSFRPQVGVVHNRGKWAGELTASAFIYTDNDDFSEELKREQDTLYALQGHIIYTHRPGLWASLSGAYGGGAKSTIDGVNKDDDTEKSIIALSIGLPITRKQGLKLAYLRGKSYEDTGDDFDRYIIAYSKMWGGP
jgi:hypothetical protein